MQRNQKNHLFCSPIEPYRDQEPWDQSMNESITNGWSWLKTMTWPWPDHGLAKNKAMTWPWLMPHDLWIYVYVCVYVCMPWPMACSLRLPWRYVYICFASVNRIALHLKYANAKIKGPTGLKNPEFMDILGFGPSHNKIVKVLDRPGAE